MNAEELDRLFDESLGRLHTNQTTPSSPYSTHPLASDHFILKKSWEYFRRRIKSIEDQWKKILQGKEEESRLAQEKMRALQVRVDDLEIENQTVHALEEEFGTSKEKDLIDFRKKTRQLEERWEEEKDIFVRAQQELESQIEKMKLQSRARENQFNEIELRLQEKAGRLEEDLIEQCENHKRAQKEWASNYSQQDEETKSFQAKADLLRIELERKDQVIHQLNGDLASKETDVINLNVKINELMEDLKESQNLNRLLDESLKISRREIDNLRESWGREQAEWRELWDRERETWERVRKIHHDAEGVDNK